MPLGSLGGLGLQVRGFMLGLKCYQYFSLRFFNLQTFGTQFRLHRVLAHARLQEAQLQLYTLLMQLVIVLPLDSDDFSLLLQQGLLKTLHVAAMMLLEALLLTIFESFRPLYEGLQRRATHP